MASGAAPAKAQAEFHEWRKGQADKGSESDTEEAWPEYWEKARMEKLQYVLAQPAYDPEPPAAFSVPPACGCMQF